MADDQTGRPNQRNRTRKDLLRAAAALMKDGGAFTLEDIAAKAEVSRATAYRYFPNLDALLLEAVVDIQTPDVETLFDGVDPKDPIARLERVDAALHDMIAQNEASVRAMLAHAATASGKDGDLPRRQNRRTPLIEAALAPARDQFKPAAFKRLIQAVAVVVGSEGYVSCKDVLSLNGAEAQKLRRWMIAALVEQARR
jgi:AcrR family transcriptional regulator